MSWAWEGVRLVAVKPDHTSEPPGGRVGFRHMILGGHKHLAHTELTSRWFSFHLSDLLDVKTPDVAVFESVVFQPFSLTCVLSIGAGFTQPKNTAERQAPASSLVRPSEHWRYMSSVVFLFGCLAGI